MTETTRKTEPILRAMYRGPVGPTDLRRLTEDPSILDDLRRLTAEGIVAQIGKGGVEVFQLTRKGENLVEGWVARRMLAHEI